MILAQHKYALDLLHRANMESCRVVSTPMPRSDKLYRDLGDRFTQDVAFLHRNLVGGLQCLTLTWHNLLFVVNKVCQFLDPPINVHYEAIKRILGYIKGIAYTSLLIQKAPSTILNIYTYANWMRCSNDRRPLVILPFFLDLILSPRVHINNLRFLAPH
jgi:histone deacetylase 1/2